MMTYGLEIECGGLRTEDELRQVIAGTRGVEYGGHFGYHGSRRLGLRCVENGNENLWVSENDGSLTAGNEGYTTPLVGPNDRGHEVISPVLRGVNGLTQARMVMKSLSRAGCIVDRRCGLHVTVGVTNTSARFRRMSKGRQAQAIGRIVDLYDYFMDAGFNSLVSQSRRPGSPNCAYYAQGIEYGYGSEQSFGVRSQEAGKTLLANGINRGALNIGNFTSNGTVEFRQHNGTLNGAKITNWALLCGRIVSWATTQEHPNFAKDLRNFTPDLAGLMDCLNLGTELRRDLTTRAGETRGWMPNNRYAQAYIEFQQGLGLEAIANAPAGWVSTTGGVA